MAEADTGIDAQDAPYVGAEAPAKVPRPSIGGSKLELQSLPWNQAWPPEVAHAVGEPDVDVDCQWRASQLMDGWEIDRYGGASDFSEKLAAEDKFWLPGWRSPLEARLEEFKSGIAGRDQAASAEGVGPPMPQAGALVEPLSERELEILRLIAAGRSNPEIAELLYLSLNTVKWHAKNLYGKLNVGSRIEAVARAQELELL